VDRAGSALFSFAAGAVQKNVSVNAREKTPFETAVGTSVKMKAKEEQEPTE
jgi:hypothetical protein